MKVWERINQINGTDAGRQTIVNWMVRNRICPLLIEEALEKEDRALHELADKHCQEFGKCSGACYVAFLDREVTDKPLTIEDAKPCPFCGNTDILDRNEIYPTWNKEVVLRSAYVFCHEWRNKGCGASIKRVEPTDEIALDKAVRAWNRRTP